VGAVRPGEVTTAALNAEVSTTSNNSNSVFLLSQVADEDCNQRQALFNKVWELVLARHLLKQLCDKSTLSVAFAPCRLESRSSFRHSSFRFPHHVS
jgi:hypothetical protein